MKIIGVAHWTSHPDYPNVLAYLDNNITPRSRVALESHSSLSDLLSRTYAQPKRVRIPKEYQEAFLCTIAHPDAITGFIPTRTDLDVSDFFSDVARRCLDKKAAVRTVDHISEAKKEALLGILLVLQEGLYPDQWAAFERASLQRSITMYQKAQRWNASHLIVGNSHAYDLQQLYGKEAIFITPTSESGKEKRNRIIKEHAALVHQ